MLKPYPKPAWESLLWEPHTAKTENHWSIKMAQREKWAILNKISHMVETVEGQVCHWLCRQFYASHLCTVQEKHKTWENN